MAKSNNFFKLRGRFGDLIFCIRDGKTYVKQYSGGFTKESMQNHPKVKASQQRLSEVSVFVKGFKQALIPYLWRQKDGTFHNQLMSVFLQLRNDVPDKSFQKILQSESTYKALKNKSLNKNSKIYTQYISYDSTANLLQINVALLRELSKKYKDFFLEVTIGHYALVEGQAYLSTPEIHYFKLDTPNLHKAIALAFTAAEPQRACMPFVGLSVVYQNNPKSPSLHPVHCIAACFV